MSDANTAATAAKPGLAQRFLDWVERAGNKLPQPVTLFAAMIVLVLLASWLFSALGTSAEHPGTGEVMSWDAPPPEDLVTLIEGLRADTAAAAGS